MHVMRLGIGRLVKVLVKLGLGNSDACLFL